jgi:hypothetical protein
MKDAKASLERLKELDDLLNDAKSCVNIDGLIDGLIALILDCEPMRKNKNIECFMKRCETSITGLIFQKFSIFYF